MPAPVRADDVPEETESKEAVEPREAGKAFVGERAVEQQVIRFRIGAHQRVLDVAAMPGLEDRELVQERERRVGHPASGFETPKLGLAGEGANHAVAGMRAEQVHALQLVAELQVRHAGVRDALLPAHLELPELGQMAEYLESAVGDPPAPRLAQIEILEPGQPRQVRETVVGQLLRSAEIQSGEMIEPRDALEHGVGHLTACVEARDSLFRHQRDDLVPFLVVERVAHLERAVPLVDAIERQVPLLRPAAGAHHAFRELDPASESARVRDDLLRVRERDLGVRQFAQQLRQLRAHLAPGEGLLEEVLDALQRRGLADTVGIEDVVGERFERLQLRRDRPPLPAMAVRVAPCCSSSAATPAAPFASATSSGVRPLPARMFGSAPFSRRSRRRFLTSHRGRPVQRRALRNVPMIEAPVDGRGILAKPCLDVLEKVERHGVVQVDRAMGPHPLDDVRLLVVVGPCRAASS